MNTRRVCGGEDCGTLLSRYNKRGVCSVCESKPKPRVVVYVAWPSKRAPLVTTCGGSAL